MIRCTATGLVGRDIGLMSQIIPDGACVRVAGRRLTLSGVTERPWTGRVIHSWDDGSGLSYLIAPDDPTLLPCEVRGEFLREMR